MRVWLFRQEQRALAGDLDGAHYSLGACHHTRFAPSVRNTGDSLGSASRRSLAARGG